MADLNALDGLATEQNTVAVSDFLSQAIALCIKLFNDFIALATENVWWILVVLILMKVEDMAIYHFGIPFPKGAIRWAALFFFTLFTAFFWKPFLQGLIPNA